MTLPLFPEWREDNKHSKFPFVDSANLTSDTSQVIGKDDILDIRLYPIGGETTLWISGITLTADTVTINFSDTTGTSCSCNWTIGATDKSENILDNYGRPAGIIVFSEYGKTKLEGWPKTTHQFSRSATELVSTCIIPQPEPGVRAFRTEDNTIFAGDVVLVGGNGVWLSDDNGKIRVDITGDFGLFRERCGTISPYLLQLPVKTINNEGPDEIGNFIFTPSDGNGNKPVFRVQIEPPNTIYITPIREM